MSKIGRKAISVGNVKVEIKDQDIHYTGPKASGVHTLPKVIKAQLEGALLKLVPSEKGSRDLNRLWGLNRALLANKIIGAEAGFEKKIEIVGLGYKAVMSGANVVFSLGYSHKIDFELPTGVSLEIDKSGQKLTFKSTDKALVGHVCSMVRSLRTPEPYKGTGVKLATEVIHRKAGKTKSA